MIAEFFIYLIPFKEISSINLQSVDKKEHPKGALCMYCNSLEERLLNCDALRAFLRPGWGTTYFI